MTALVNSLLPPFAITGLALRSQKHSLKSKYGRVFPVLHCKWLYILFSIAYKSLDQGSLTPGHGQVAVQGLLGTGPHSRRWEVASQRSFICCSPSLPLPPEPSPTPTTPSVEKLSSTKPVPGDKKVGDQCLRWPTSPAILAFRIFLRSQVSLQGLCTYLFLSEPENGSWALPSAITELAALTTMWIQCHVSPSQLDWEQLWA